MRSLKTSMAFAPVLSLLVVLVVGYLGSQSEGMLNGYLLDFGGVPATAIAKRFPWELQFAAVLIAFAGVVAYRKLAPHRPSKVMVLGALVVAAVLSALLYEVIHTTRTSLFAMAFVNGGTSPLTSGLIAVVTADIIYSNRHLEQT